MSRSHVPAPRPAVLQRPGAPGDQRFADLAVAEMFDAIHASMLGHERSQQKLIGPSEIGVPCERALLYKLAQADEPPRMPGWKPQVGTYCHAGMEGVFGTEARQADGWLVEQRLHVGEIGGTEITGSCDLFQQGGLVNDWKFVSAKKLKAVKASNDPGPQYVKQAHLYGKGWQDDGYPVQVVMITFLPRDGELADGYVWWAPYDRQVAVEALKRANARYDLLKQVGLTTAVSLFPYCTEFFCDWCNHDRQRESAGSMFKQAR